MLNVNNIIIIIIFFFVIIASLSRGRTRRDTHGRRRRPSLRYACRAQNRLHTRSTAHGGGRPSPRARTGVVTARVRVCVLRCGGDGVSFRHSVRIEVGTQFVRVCVCRNAARIPLVPVVYRPLAIVDERTHFHVVVRDVPLRFK